MSQFIETEVSVDEIGIENKISALFADPVVMLQIHNEFARLCNPYVPFLEGPLSQTVEIMPDYVRYIQPYARYQYYGVNFNHTLDYHPLASAMWDKAMLRDHRDEFLEAVRLVLIRRAQEKYG